MARLVVQTVDDRESHRPVGMIDRRGGEPVLGRGADRPAEPPVLVNQPGDDRIQPRPALGRDGRRPALATEHLVQPPVSPGSEAHQGWVLGGPDFVARFGQLVRGGPPQESRRESRLVQGVSLGGTKWSVERIGSTRRN